MDNIFMNSENSKRPDSHRLWLSLLDNIKLKRSDKYVALSTLGIYCIWKNIKKSHKNIKFKRVALTWNQEFELPHRSYSVSDIQSYLAYVIKKHEKNTDNPSIMIYVNRKSRKSKIEDRSTFKIKAGYYLERLTPGTMKLREAQKVK